MSLESELNPIYHSTSMGLLSVWHFKDTDPGYIFKVFVFVYVGLFFCVFCTFKLRLENKVMSSLDIKGGVHLLEGFCLTLN